MGNTLSAAGNVCSAYLEDFSMRLQRPNSACQRASRTTMLLVAWVAAGMMWNIPGGGPTYAVPVSSGNSLSSASGTEQNSATQPGRANPAVEARLVAAYGKLPLSFEANSGQADDSVKFLSHGRGYTVSLTATEAALCFGAPERCGTRCSHRGSLSRTHPLEGRIPSSPEATPSFMIPARRNCSAGRRISIR